MRLIKRAENKVKKKRPKIRPKIKINYVNKQFVIQFLLGINYHNDDLNNLIEHNNIVTFNSHNTNFKIVFETLTVEYKNKEIKFTQHR